MHHLCTPDDGNKPPFVYCLINGLYYITLIWALEEVQNESEVCKSMHHRTIQINNQPVATIFQFCYPDVYLQFNMFRAFPRSSSGAQGLHWQPVVLPSYRGDSRAVFVVGPAGWPARPRTRPKHVEL